MKRAMTILSTTFLTYSVLLGCSAALAQSSSKNRIWRKAHGYSYSYYNTYPAFWRGTVYVGERRREWRLPNERVPHEYRPFVFYPRVPFAFGDIASVRAFERTP